ncbi:STAS domain-containing protein [Pilimelia columellifera]
MTGNGRPPDAPTVESVGPIPVIQLMLVDDYKAADADRLSAQLDEAIRMRPRQLLIDVSRCRVMDVSAIDVLLDAHRRIRRIGGSLTLVSPSGRLRRNLTFTRADLVLDLAATLSVVRAAS